MASDLPEGQHSSFSDDLGAHVLEFSSWARIRRLKFREIMFTQAATNDHILVECKTWTYHGRVGSGRRMAGRRSGAGTGRTGRRRVGSLRIQLILLPPGISTKTVLVLSPGARTSELLSNLPIPKPGHTTGGSGRVGAGRRMAGPEGTSTVRFAQETSDARSHQGTEDNCPGRLFGSTGNLIRTYDTPTPLHSQTCLA